MRTSDFTGAMDPYCQDSRECFGAVMFRGFKKCTILRKTYQADGECAFCKPEARKTNGKIYPYNKDYFTVED